MTRKMLRSQRRQSKAPPMASALPPDLALCSIAEHEPLPVADATTVKVTYVHLGDQWVSALFVK